MSRSIKFFSAKSNQAVTIYPDHVPHKPLSDPVLQSGPLVLYIYRVPGRKDVFLTKYKIPNQSPTDLDVNQSLFYLRYDDLGAHDMIEDRRTFSPRSTKDVSDIEMRNSSQLSLIDRRIINCNCTKMTLVGVDLQNDDVRELATMLDPRPPHSTLTRRRASSIPHNETSDDSMYIDIFNPAYKPFGLDVGYLGGKAFTRRMFKPEPSYASFNFATPWSTQVAMQNQHQLRDTFKSYHIPSGDPLDKSPVSELRCNFPAVPKMGESRDVLRTGGNGQSDAVRKITRGLPAQALNYAHISSNHRWSAISLSPGILHRPSAPYPHFELAQERLGGGRGDEAKLGKLIILPEGQHFLDLMVAANLLVFNRIYEHATQRLG